MVRKKLKQIKRAISTIKQALTPTIPPVVNGQFLAHNEAIKKILENK
jgi:hypothetical protein